MGAILRGGRDFTQILRSQKARKKLSRLPRPDRETDYRPRIMVVLQRQDIASKHVLERLSSTFLSSNCEQTYRNLQKLETRFEFIRGVS